MDAVASLIEVANGPHTGTGTGNRPTTMESHYLDYLNLGFHLAPTANQDNHKRTWGSVTEARTAVIADALTRAALLAALRARHVYATLDRNLTIIARVNGHLIGDVIDTDLPDVGDQLAITVEVSDEDEPNAAYRVQVFSDDGPGGDDATLVESFFFDGDTPNGQPFSISEITFRGDGQYVFLKIRQSDEHGNHDLAWTAPVWFEATSTTMAGPTVRILSLLPNPAGDEEQTEQATIRNDGPGSVDLRGWVLRDRAGREWSLDSLKKISEGAEKTIVRNGQPMWMNNSGEETILLIDSDGRVVHTVSYTGTTEGQPIEP